MIGKGLLIFLAVLAMTHGSAAKDRCEKKTGCGKCLNAKFGCAYHVIGKALPRCISEDRCGTEGFEGGTCYKGSEITNTKKTCKLIKNPPLPTEPPVGIGDGDDLIGLKMCSNFSGESDDACGTCLKQGCAWVDGGLCADSCTSQNVPADVGCSILPKDQRSLLRFDGQASEICYKLNLDKKNNQICTAAGNEGGCKKCVSTPIATPPGTYYITEPTCQYYPAGNGCIAVAGGLIGPGTITCDGDGDDPVDFEQCSDFSGEFDDACGTCLQQGCAWVDAMSLCADSCTSLNVPADVGCSILPEDRRSLLLLEIDGPASEICLQLNLDKKNNQICTAAGNEGGCEKCVSTSIASLPDTVHITEPTCQYHSAGKAGINGCLAVADWYMEPGTTTCTEWPELLEKTADEGKKFLFDIYGTELKIMVVNPGDSVIADYLPNRVRLYVNEIQIIIKIPTIG